ncbi:hypothetical protein QP157_18515 [Sphingomonas sp. LR61]
MVEWAQFGQQADAWVWRSAVKHRTLRADQAERAMRSPQNAAR